MYLKIPAYVPHETYRHPSRSGEVQARQAFAVDGSLTAAPPAPLVGVDDPAGEHSPLRLEELADDLLR